MNRHLRSFVQRTVVGLALAAVVLCARADQILLKDGRLVSGKLSRSGDQIVIHADDGKVVTVSADQVQRVTLTGAMTAAEKSEVEWTKIQATIARTDDLRTITAALAGFLRSFPEVPLAAKAQAALDQYNQYVTQGLVKFRNQWVAPEARDAVLHQADSQARLALMLYRDGKVKDAQDALTEALKTYNEDPTAVALSGLLAARAGQWVKAKEFFQKLSTIDLANILAWNNMAVISYIQHRDPEGLLQYKKALDANAGNRLLLDNIVEALAAYKGSTDIPAYKDLTLAFAQAEARMVAIMAQRDMYRWGSTWVTGPQRDRLQAAIQAVQAQMADLDARYQQITVTLAALQQQVRQLQIDYDAEVADINSLDAIVMQEQAQGYVDLVLVGRRDALLADLASLYRKLQDARAQRNALQGIIGRMKIDAEHLKAQLAAAQSNVYTGVQRIMEIGDAESPPPPAAVNLPASVPATAPAPVPGATGLPNR